MKAHYIIAAAFAALVLATLQITSSGACTNDKYLCEPATPTEFGSRKSSAEAAIEVSAKQNRRQRVRASKTSPEQPAATSVSQDAAGRDENEAVPIVVVRTTRETTGAAVPLVAADELNEIDQAASSLSLVAFSIMSYLGELAATTVLDDVQHINTSDIPSEAQETPAAVVAEAPQKPAEVALEYILMTFGGALAAASAIRLFVI